MQAQCDAVLSEFISGVHALLKILHVVGPILLILALVLAFARGVLNPDTYEKKGLNSYINSIIAAIVLFMLPYIVNVTVNIFDPDETFSVSRCWNLAERASKSNGGYVEDNDSRTRDKFITESSDTPATTNKKKKK